MWNYDEIVTKSAECDGSIICSVWVLLEEVEKKERINKL